MVILAKHSSLTNTQIKLLEKGLTFICSPKPRRDQRLELQFDAQSYHRRIELALYFKDNQQKFDKTNFNQRFIQPSQWRPPRDKLPPEMAMLIKQDLKTIQHLDLSTSVKANISEEEEKELYKLKTNHNLVVKPADKGGSVVIMDRDQYILEAERQLKDPAFYKELEKPLYPQTKGEVKQILESLHKQKYINAKQKQYLMGPTEPRIRKFYILPKIHKPKEKWTIPGEIPPGRPIVSDCSSDTYGTAELLEFYLTPLAQKHWAYVKDTGDFINKIRDLPIPQEALFLTIDINNLYTTIPIPEGIEAVRKAFLKHPDPRRPDRELLKLLEINLTKNDFEFNNKIYLQLTGTAMGKRFAPGFAGLFMNEWDDAVLQKAPKKPLVYLRYLDDIFVCWTHGEEELTQFLTLLNTHNPAITIKHTMSEVSVDFLDTTVYKGPNFCTTHRVDIKMFFKETDSHALLYTSSYHPRNTFKGIIKSQLIRFNRICTRIEDFYYAMKVLFKALRSRGYTRTFLRQCYKTFQDQGEKRPQILPFVTTYTPASLALASKYKNSFFQFITSQGLLPRYGTVNAFKKNVNLKQLLVRASLPTAQNFEKPEPTALTKIFTRLRWVKNKTTGQVHQIQQRFGPNTTNCVYLIFCNICGVQYVGIHLTLDTHSTDIILDTQNNCSCP